MEHIKPEFLEDYTRVIKDLNDPYISDRTIGILEVLKGHYLIVDYFDREYGEGIGGVGPRDIGLLQSTMGRQLSSFSSFTKWDSSLDICSTLFFGLIKNHPFHDANKRTAFLTLLYHLWKIRRKPIENQKVFEILALRVASNTLNLYPEYKESKLKTDQDKAVQCISKLLRKYTKELDRREYIITFQDLNNILRKFYCNLRDPDNNKIDVYIRVTRSSGFFSQRDYFDEKRVGSTGFPGWRNQVSKDDLKRVRQLTGLTAENGYDSDTFYGDTDPLPALIPQYQKLLKRLSDK